MKLKIFKDKIEREDRETVSELYSVTGICTNQLIYWGSNYNYYNDTTNNIKYFICRKYTMIE